MDKGILYVLISLARVAYVGAARTRRGEPGELGKIDGSRRLVT